MEMPGRTGMMDRYRFGFNGKENDREWGTAGLTQDYGMRLYNPAVGRFLSVDPLAQDYPFYTPYQFAGNTPIEAVDLDGLEQLHVVRKGENPWSIAQHYGVSLHELAKANTDYFTGDITSPDYFTKGAGKLWNIDEGNVVDVPVSRDQIIYSDTRPVFEVLGNDLDSYFADADVNVEASYPLSSEDEVTNTILFALAWGLDIVDPSSSNKRKLRPRRGGIHANGSGSSTNIDVSTITPTSLGKKYKGQDLDPNFKSFNVTHSNRNISSKSIKPGEKYSFVLTNNGELKIGPAIPGAHYELAGGAGSVRGAGKIQFDANGKINYLDNDSGHYTPSVGTSNAAFNALRRSGYTSANAINGTMDFDTRGGYYTGY